jgi:hypothetical protein
VQCCRNGIIVSQLGKSIRSDAYEAGSLLPVAFESVAKIRSVIVVYEVSTAICTTDRKSVSPISGVELTVPQLMESMTHQAHHDPFQSDPSSFL